MKPKRVLNFKILKYIKTFVILFVALVGFIALGRYFNKVFLKVTYLFYGLILVFFAILMINVVKYLLTFVKYKKSNVENDLLNPITKRYDKCHTYIGQDYIVCNHVNLLIRRYDELIWVYMDDNYTKVFGYTTGGSFITVCNVDSKETGDSIIKDIWNHNPNILMGNNDETRKQYNNMRKGSHK